ncbi:MAG: hypothetical protein LWY06_06950 [Firmicutes bacterium]|nr:hypothetical protein [Bacillota bacterium]
MKRNSFLTAAIILILALLVIKAPSARAQTDTPTKAALAFFQSLGYMNYKKSYSLLASEAKRNLLSELRSYYLTKGENHTTDELEYMIELNQGEYRTMLFDTLFSRLTMKMGVKASSFQNASVSLIKGGSETAKIRLEVSGKKASYNMVKENGQWKVICY